MRSGARLLARTDKMEFIKPFPLTLQAQYGNIYLNIFSGGSYYGTYQDH